VGRGQNPVFDVELIGVVVVAAIAQPLGSDLQVIGDAVAKLQPDLEATGIEAHEIPKGVLLEGLVAAVVDQEVQGLGSGGLGVHHIHRPFDARVVFRVEPQGEDLRAVDLLDRLGSRGWLGNLDAPGSGGVLRSLGLAEPAASRAAAGTTRPKLRSPADKSPTSYRRQSRVFIRLLLVGTAP